MLPIPIFLLLVFGVAILAPAPAILIHLTKTVGYSAPQPHISTMPALPSTFLPRAEETMYLPVVPGPQLTLDVAPVCRGQSFVGMAPNSTIPLLRGHEASGYTPYAAILPVVVLAMVNCLVYKLLVDDTRSEEELEQTMVPCQPEHLTSILSEESTYLYTIFESPSPRPVINTNMLTTGTLEHDRLSDVVTDPSCLEPGRGPLLFEQSSQFPGVLSYGVLTGDSEMATDHDSSLATLAVSGCTSCDDWTQVPKGRSTGSSLETLVATIKYSELVPPQCGPPAVNIGVDLSSVPLPQELEHQSKPQDDPIPLSASTCDVNNARESFLFVDPEGDDDGETFDYKGVDWEPSVLAPSPTAETCVTTSSSSSLELHFQHCGTLSKAEHEPASLSFSTSAPREAELQSSTMYASDDIQVGVKSKNEANTRRRIKCASADDLRGMVDLVQTTPFPVPDNESVTSLPNIADKCISINQVAPLRADLPVLTPSTSAIREEVTSFTGPPHPPVFVGLRASIHAPRDDDLSQTQTEGCHRVGTLDSMHATKQENPLQIDSHIRSHSLELVSAAGGIRESTHSPIKPDSQELAHPVAAESSRSRTSELESPTLAEIPVPPTTQVIVGSTSPRGLAASIHAPQGCQAIHSADAPNWAAAARADSTAAVSRGSGSAERGITPNQDDSDQLDVPTAIRCAAVRDENEGSGVDDSDGGSTMHPTGDRWDGAPAGFYETDSGLDAADDSNEQESTTTRSRRSRRRGKPRRPRTKVPYLPPPRMRNLTQHPVVDMILEARALHRLATGSAVSNGQHYSLPRHPASVSDQPLADYYQTPQQHMGSPSTAPTPLP